MKSIGKRALASIIMALLASCSSGKVERERSWLSFRCPDGRAVMARFEPQDEFVNVQFAGRELRLPHVISGSGARYSDGKATFWNKGNSALLEVDDKIVVQDCVLQEELPPVVAEPDS
jgi:membrane-bound inhibitor of C-type lysozyme